MEQGEQFGKIEKTKKVIKTSTGLIVIFGAVVLFFGGALTYWYYNDPNNYGSSTDATAVATVSNSNTNSTTDWKTYTNDANGFSLKYPMNWFVDTTSDTSIAILSNYEKASQYDKSNSPADLLRIGIMEYTATAESANQENIISQTIVNDITVLSLRNSEDVATSKSVYQKIGKFTAGGKIWKLWMSSELSTDSMQKELAYFDQIVSTFKLTTPTSAIPNSLTYTNSTYGFTLTLPASWSAYKVKSANVEGEKNTYYFTLPTTDPIYAEATTTADAGYAAPFVIGVMEKANWTGAEDQLRDYGSKIGEDTNYVYTVSYWQAKPTDISDALVAAVKSIVASFKLN